MLNKNKNNFFFRNFDSILFLNFLNDKFNISIFLTRIFFRNIIKILNKFNKILIQTTKLKC